MNYFIANKNLFYPAVVFSLSWTVILALHLFFGLTVLHELYPLGLETFVTLWVGDLCFSLACFVITSTYRKNKKTRHNIKCEPNTTPNRTLRLIFMAILVIGLPFYIQAVYKIFIASQIDNFFVGIRTELSYGDEDIGITKYLVTLSFVVFATNYYSYLKDSNSFNKTVVLSSLILTIAYSIFATGRTFFFLILCVYMGISYLMMKKFSIRKYLLPMIFFVLIFVSIGIIYGKGGNVGNTLKENIHSAAETTSIYLVSSLTAFDIETKKHVRASYGGENTLLFFVKIGQKLNLVPENIKQGTLLSDFVFVPYPTNVFTFYSPYVRDYGRIYAFFMIALFGALHTWLFHKAIETRNLRYAIYYSFLLYPVLMSFFQDQYMSLFSTWLQIILATEIFLLINRMLFKPKT